MRACARGLAVTVCACWAVAARADDAWPSPSPEWLSRDAAGGVAILPLACWWAWVAAWAATSDWIHRDANRFKVRPEFWTPLAMFPFAAAALLAWWIPWSAAGQALMALAWVLPLYLYGRERNPKAPQAESIFTRVHLRRAGRAILGRLGVKLKPDEVADTGLPWVKLVATSAQTPEENQRWQAEAAAMPGFDAATEILQLAAAARATAVVVEMAADGFRVGHEVDGISGPARGRVARAKGAGKARQPEQWGDAPPFDAKAGTAALEALKVVAGWAAAKLGGDRDAGFTIEVDGKKRACRLAERVTKTAKQAVITLEVPPIAPKKLEDLGMSATVANQVRELVALEKGLFVVSAPPASGCTTTFDMVLSSTDRLVRDFVSIEDSGSPQKEVQNVKPVRYSSASGEKPVQALKAAMLEYPRAVVTRDLTDAELAGKLLELADDQQLVIVSMRAADAIDAIGRLLALGIDRERLARCLLGSLCQRLVRKLCPKCADAMSTPPEVLKRLGKTAEELPQVKRASPHGGCPACAGRQFVGRTAIFELAAGPTVRQAIAKGVDAKVLRQAAVKDGMRSLPDEALVAVAAGVTSLEERQRIFAAQAAKKEAGVAGAKK